MKILAVGGGSGGHVTPVVAVVSELQQLEPGVEIRFWCDRKFARQARASMHHHNPALVVDTVISGKFRRYNTLPLWKQLFRWRTIVIPNVIDGVKIAAGTIQSLGKLLRWRPDVVFTKGGFVCLPVGVAAHILRIPLVIHDSDAHPGLTNRILARWATKIATGAPLKHYPYPKDRAVHVGIPVKAGLTPMTEEKRREVKKSLGFDEKRPLVVVTGGGLGARRLNDATVAVLDDLLAFTSVMLVSGTKQFDELQQKTKSYPPSFQLRAFVSENFPDVLGAADIVVSRAGATTLLELAALAKPVVLVPNAYLTGGHQLKNAAVYEEGGAAVMLDEERLVAEPLALVDTLNALVLNKNEMQRLAKAIHHFSTPHAARDMAQLIINAVKQ